MRSLIKQYLEFCLSITRVRAYLHEGFINLLFKSENIFNKISQKAQKNMPPLKKLYLQFCFSHSLETKL